MGILSAFQNSPAFQQQLQGGQGASGGQGGYTRPAPVPTFNPPMQGGGAMPEDIRQHAFLGIQPTDAVMGAADMGGGAWASTQYGGAGGHGRFNSLGHINTSAPNGQWPSGVSNALGWAFNPIGTAMSQFGSQNNAGIGQAFGGGGDGVGGSAGSTYNGGNRFGVGGGVKGNDPEYVGGVGVAKRFKV